MPITFGGKSFEQAVTDQVIATTNAEPHDPFPTAKELRRGNTQQQLLSVFADNVMWIDQLLYEMSALARKRWRLCQKLKEPSLQNHPGLRKARADYEQWGDELVDYADRIQRLEIVAERYWQALDVETRGGYGMDFGLPASEQNSLLGQTWKYKATTYRWPVAYTVPSQGWRHLPWPYWPDRLQELDGYQLGQRFEW